MNHDQQLLSWLAVFGLIIGIWLTYRTQLSGIIFGTNLPQQGGTIPLTPEELGQLGTGLYPNANGSVTPVPATSFTNGPVQIPVFSA